MAACFKVNCTNVLCLAQKNKDRKYLKILIGMEKFMKQTYIKTGIVRGQLSIFWSSCAKKKITVGIYFGHIHVYMVGKLETEHFLSLIRTLTGAPTPPPPPPSLPPLARKVTPVQVKEPYGYSKWLLAGLHPATQSVQCTLSES